MIHYLKILSKYYIPICIGVKTFELRKNDRNFKVGDFIRFHVIDDFGFIFTPLYIIVYILDNVSEYGLDSNYCILGIKQAI